MYPFSCSLPCNELLVLPCFDRASSRYCTVQSQIASDTEESRLNLRVSS